MEEVGSLLGRFLQQHASTQQRAVQVEVARATDKIILREIGMAFCSLPTIPPWARGKCNSRMPPQSPKFPPTKILLAFPKGLPTGTSPLRLLQDKSRNWIAVNFIKYVGIEPVKLLLT